MADNAGILEVPAFSVEASQFLTDIVTNFSLTDAQAVKDIEKTTNHDVKAVEYFLKDKIKSNKELNAVSEFFHFACTSEDINNLSHALMLIDGRGVLIAQMQNVLSLIINLAQDNAAIPMLSRTHGQTASPTTVGKEMANFAYRLKRQIKHLESVTKITFTIFKINRINFVWHSGRTYLASNGFLLEITQRNIPPNITTKINQNSVKPIH
jgi:adenylosuccinate lyase